MVTTSLETNKKYYTRAEYLQLEEIAEEKHEYHNGEIIKMTGGTTNHNKLAGKIYALLLSILEDQNYEIYIGDVRLWIEQYNRYTYPDVMVIKDQPIYEGKNKTTVTNPYLIIEVLSNSTQDYDQNAKFDAYRTIPNFQEYILIDQYQYYIKQFAKNDQNKWVLTDIYSLENTLKLESINLEIPLQNLYKKVAF